MLASYAYTLGPAGHRTRVDEHDGTSRHYLYDGLYRLTQDRVTDASSAQVYQRDYVYDPVGNRTQQILDEGTGPTAVDSTYDERDRLLTAAGVSYGWDSDGNLASRDEMALEWDYEHRLTSVTLTGGTVVETVYDADGNRVRAAVTPPGGATTAVDFLVDPTGRLSHVVAEVVAGSVHTLYTRAVDELIGLYRPASGASRYFHADGLGSVRALSDEQGAVTDSYTYTAFGSLLEHVGSDPQPYRFAGEPLDPNTGFYYNRARWMDPGSGRFLSVDPFGGSTLDPASLHRYLYSAADPVNATDPTGRYTFLNITITAAAKKYVLGIGAFTLLGGIIGGVDAALGGDPIWPAVRGGAAFGFGVGVFWPYRYWRIFVRLFVIFTATLGAIESFSERKFAQGVFRIGIALLAFFAGTGRRTPPRSIRRADSAGIQRIVDHLRSLRHEESRTNAWDEPYNRSAVQRLRDGKWEKADQEFYRHELLEAELMERGMPYEQAHELALREFDVIEMDLYHPEVLRNHPEYFNRAWFEHHHMEHPAKPGGDG